MSYFSEHGVIYYYITLHIWLTSVCSNCLPEDSTFLEYNGKPGVSYGMVMVEHLGIRGGICDSNFTDEDATVVCREIGYSTGSSYCCGALGSIPETNPMWMGDVVCNGSESNLTDCAWDGIWGVTPELCPRHQTSAVVCYAAVQGLSC